MNFMNSFAGGIIVQVQITGEHTILMIFGKIINRGVVIFTDYVVHLNHENKYLRKYNLPIDSCL